MKITRLRGGNSQFPEEKVIGDVTVLSLGDIFCWDGKFWRILGGRFIPEAMRESFLSYIKTGWPDEQSAQYDLPTLFDLSVFEDYGQWDMIPADPKMVNTFHSRVLEAIKAIKNNGGNTL